MDNLGIEETKNTNSIKDGLFEKNIKTQYDADEDDADEDDGDEGVNLDDFNFEVINKDTPKDIEPSTSQFLILKILKNHFKKNKKIMILIVKKTVNPKIMMNQRRTTK